MNKKFKNLLVIFSLIVFLLLTVFLIKSCSNLSSANMTVENVLNKMFVSRDRNYFVTFLDMENGLFYHDEKYEDFSFRVQDNVFICEREYADVIEFRVDLIVRSDTSFYCQKYNVFLHLLGGK